MNQPKGKWGLIELFHNILFISYLSFLLMIHIMTHIFITRRGWIGILIFIILSVIGFFGIRLILSA